MTLLFFFAKFTIPYMKQKSVLAKGEIMIERVTAVDLRHVETKIIMTEDKMFREREYCKKVGNQRRNHISEKQITENAVSKTGGLVKLSFLLYL